MKPPIEKNLTVQYQNAWVFFAYYPTVIPTIIKEAKNKIKPIQTKRNCSEIDALFIYLSSQFLTYYSYFKTKQKAIDKMISNIPFLKNCLLNSTIKFLSFSPFNNVKELKIENFSIEYHNRENI